VQAVSAFADVRSLPPQQIWDGILGRTVHGERVTLSLLELDAGAVVPEHSHENEQVGILLDGTVLFTVGGEQKELGRGSTWRILGNIPHSVEVGPDGAIIVEAFSPIRGDWQALEEREPAPGRWP
jgi:quercetin dioxygenase-like cupin family protein